MADSTSDESDTTAGVDLVLPGFGDDGPDGVQPGDPEARSRRRWGRWVFLGLVLALVAATGVIWLRNVTVAPRPVASPIPPPFEVHFVEVQPGSAVPVTGSVVPAADPAQAAWIGRVSSHTDIPRRALQAYVHAQFAVVAADPACHLSWTILAGIGWAETHHGQWHGDSIGPDGEELTPIVGPALDGSAGMQKITDTDHGRLDGDPVWDHAIGPMQFVPSTWLRWGTRASGDGRPADPQNIDDAALSAGRYLCASGGDLGTPAGWWQSTWVYNNSAIYGEEVFSGATSYALASR